MDEPTGPAGFGILDQWDVTLGGQRRETNQRGEFSR